MRRFTLPALCLALLAPCTSTAFELATHALITQKAYERFVQENPAKLNRIGVVTYFSDLESAEPLGKTYFDLSGGLAVSRHDWPFENSVISRLSTGIGPLTIPGWLMRGAIREDDGVIPIFSPNPKDDPWPSPPNRFLNHFYDPVLDRPLTVGVALGARSPNWAMGAVNAFASPNTPDANRRNHFTVFDAREAMFRALTLRARAAGGDFVDLSTAKTAQALVLVLPNSLRLRADRVFE